MPETHRSRSVRPVWIGIIIVLTFISFAPSLGNGFVYDDRSYVLNNEAVTSPSFATVFLSTFPPQRADQALYRPALTLSFIVDRQLGGSSPARWAMAGHLHNLFIHVIVALLLFVFLARRAGPSVAGCIATLFAVHPALTENVAWITARSDMLVAAWCLAGLLVMRADRLRSWHKAVLLFVTAVVAATTKETGITVPVIWLAAAWTDHGTKMFKTGCATSLIPSLMVIPAVLILRFAVLGTLSPEIRVFEGLPAGTRYTIVFASFMRYFRIIIAPFGLTVHWPPLPLYIGTLRLASICGGILLSMLLVVCLFWLLRRGEPGLGITWYLVALLPASNLLVPIGTIMAERFLYLPMIGIGILATSLLGRLTARMKPRASAVLISVCVTVIAAVFVPSTFRQSATWRTDITMWRHASESLPDDLLAQGALVFGLVRNGTYADMAEADERWSQLRSALADCHPSVPDQIGRDRLAYIEAELAQWRQDFQPPTHSASPTGPPKGL